MEVVGYLCLFILREVKQAGYACGGGTEIYKLPIDASKYKRRMSVWSEQDVLAGFPQTTTDMLLACADPRIDDSQFESRILDYIHRFRNLRHVLHRSIRESERDVGSFTATATSIIRPESNEP